MLLPSILLLISTVIGQSIGLPCPSGCTCIQRTVRCIRLHLSKIPPVPSDTTIIDLRYNEIREIPSNAFSGLPNLHTIFLSENQIGLLHEDAFKGLSTLKYLYLNNNRISKISPDAFQGLNQLQSLYLENNDIWELDAKTFSNLPQLGRLFLSRNKITVLPLGVFRNLPSLKRLRLDGNPIECDCSLLSFLRHIRTLKRQPIVVLTCTTPAPLNRRTFVSLREKDFHCKKPKLMDQPRDVQVAVGQTVEMPCSAIGDPVPEVIWMQNSNEIDTYSTSRIQVLNNGSLRIVHATKQDVGMYECMARNSLGEVKSRPIRMTVNNDLHLSRPNFERPRFILAPNDQFVTSSDTIILHCVAAGFPVPQIQWYFNDNLITQSTERVQVLSNGTVVIDEPTESNSGAYKCSARNNLGTSYAVAHVQVNVTTPSTANTTEDDSLVISVELPKIILAPENQTVKSGSTLVLECDAEGDPQPTIMWRRNGTLLATSRSASNRINFDNENTELQIEHVKESDSGQYVCIAENENGRIEASADVIVENARGPPRLLFEPYDMEVLPGTTIEIPCKGEGDPAPQVKWRKDGNTITANNDRLRITPAGSLYISNITQADAGRYECSVTNQFGRAMANGLLTIRKPEIITPGDKYVRIAYEEASREIDQAINHTIDYLFSNRSSDMAHNYGELFRLFRYPNSPERQLARAAEIYERTLVNIRKHVDAGANLTAKRDDYEYQELLSPEHLNLVAELSGCMTSRRMPNCTDMCFHSKYRSVDGTCNNLNNPMWGSSLTAFRRLLKPIYENGFSMPIGWTKGKLYHGFPKPSARLISTTLISTKEITPDDEITHMVMQWGQFLDHDLDHAIPSVSSESWDGIDCKKTCDYAAPCYPIEVPPNDPRIRNRRCIDLVRSSAICGSGMTSVFFEAVQPREQINQLTSFIDASQVYGYSEEFARELRNLSSDDGRLRTGVHFPNQKDMLPFAAPQDGIDCRRNVEESSINCFVAGDIRVNEQVGLLAMHVIWMREHNRIADKLKFLNPHWDGDLTYEEARKVVGAQMQHITYKHWLPKILGHEGMQMLGEYEGYNPNLNPSISNEFATAALRFGHSLINPILHRLDTNYQPISQGHLQLHKAFFSPWRLVHEGGVDPLMRGMFSVPAKLKMPSQNLNTELTEKLFHTAHAVALDLAAINIQRGRDHAIPGYNEYRRLCNMTVAERFDDLRHEISSIEIRNKLKELYGHPSNIDVWVGGILEDQVAGGKVGPLFRCILVDQFKRLRDGDRFYYENPSVFLPEQLREIKQASLGRVMCDNGDNITEVTDDLFILPTHQGGYKKCYDIPGINLYFWQDCGSCGNTLPPIFDSYIPSTYKKPTTPPHRNTQTLSTPQRSKRSLPDDSANQNYTINEIHDDDLIDMHEERVEGLEELINIFQKELKKLKKRVKKLEQQCNQNNNKHQHHHCQDSSGNRRLNNEIWNQDECTKCQCKHPQVTCITEKCGPIVCPNNAQPVKSPDECCPTCPPPIPVVTTRETEITTGSFGYEAGTAATGA